MTAASASRLVARVRLSRRPVDTTARPKDYEPVRFLHSVSKGGLAICEAVFASLATEHS